MLEKHTDLIVSAKEACPKPVKEEKTLLQKGVAGYFIVKDIMFVNHENHIIHRLLDFLKVKNK
jgi:hypothetical protein